MHANADVKTVRRYLRDMKRIVLALGLAAGCVNSPNYYVAYAPVTGTTTKTRPAAVQRAVIALTDAGREVESSDATTGIVLSKWFTSDAALVGGDVRFRVRIVFDESNGFEVEALCSRKDGSAWTEDCADSDDKRPRFVVDLVAKVAKKLR